MNIDVLLPFVLAAMVVFGGMWAGYNYDPRGHFHWWHRRRVPPDVYNQMGVYDSFSVYRFCRCGKVEIQGAHDLGTYWVGVNTSERPLAWILLSERS